MKAINTSLDGVVIIEPAVFGDHRGYFCEIYSKEKFCKLGIFSDFVQDNESFTARRGTIRGIHFQNEPKSQAKLVRVARGAVLDVAVDLRKGSPNYLKWTAVELSAENHRMLYLPRGFGHGFVTLTDEVLFVYKVDEVYAPECDCGVRYDDPQIAVDWQVSDPILSDKDRNAPALADSACNFNYKENV